MKFSLILSGLLIVLSAISGAVADEGQIHSCCQGTGKAKQHLVGLRFLIRSPRTVPWSGV